MRQHVFAVAAFCALSDAVLIALGVAGVGRLIEATPVLMPVLRWAGAAFLLWYSARSFACAWRGGQSLQAAATAAPGLGPTLATASALTWLNPHVYLDTMVLLGTISTRFPQPAVFGAGAMLASLVFFFALGYGARLLVPVFARPRAWQVLDALVGAVMWVIAATLIRHG